MNTIKLLAAFCITTCAFGQKPTPAPKKVPLPGFGNTSLDRKSSVQTAPAPVPSPAAPVAAPPNGTAAAAAGGLKLDGHWDTLSGLSDRGPLTQRQEMRALLKDFIEPGKNTSAQPGMAIYRNVKYLLPVEKAKEELGLKGQMGSGGKPSVVGFPPGLAFSAFSAIPGRSFEVRLIFDRANQVVAVEYVATDERNLPPAPEILPPPDRSFIGKTYDFVPRGDSIFSRPFRQSSWNRQDYVLIATRGGPKAADLYIPKRMVSIILYFLDLQGTK